MNIPDMKISRREIYARHREFNRRHFSSDGAWIGPSSRDGVGCAREWLWHAVAFLDGDGDDVCLGNALAAATPNVANHFNPIAAAHLLLRYPDQITNRARQHLLTIITDGLPEAVHFALATTGATNYSSMHAFLFLAASQLVETYPVAHRHQSISQVYNRFRLRRFGLNVLQLMEDQLARTDLAQEFNSPTYSPITLLGMAEIVNLIEHDPAREAAGRIECRLWQELLQFQHPRLHRLSGPHSRATTVDAVGHGSHWKMLTCFLGLDGAASVHDLNFRPLESQVLAEDDLTSQQAVSCWIIRPDYHVPLETRSAYQDREFPYEIQATYEWPGSGFRRSDGKVVLNVEGDFKNAGGRGTVCCYQQETYSIGSMSETCATQNLPCQIVYRLASANHLLGDTRSVTVLMLTQSQPSQGAMPVQLPNNGHFQLRQNQNIVTGHVQPYHWSSHQSAPDGCDEISFNLFVSEHLPVGRSVEKVSLDGKDFADVPLEQEAQAATFAIEDGAVRITCSVQAEEQLRFHVGRQLGFLRCAAILYEGTPRMFTPAELAHFGVRFSIEVTERP